MEKVEFDETFSKEEILLIEELAKVSIKKELLHSEKEIFDKLRI
jgi:hypothetical protein